MHAKSYELSLQLPLLNSKKKKKMACREDKSMHWVLQLQFSFLSISAASSFLDIFAMMVYRVTRRCAEMWNCASISSSNSWGRKLNLLTLWKHSTTISVVVWMRTDLHRLNIWVFSHQGVALLERIKRCGLAG